MTPDVAVMLGLIGYWQQQFVVSRGKGWRAPKAWRETCPWPGCDEPRGDVHAFIDHFAGHVPHPTPAERCRHGLPFAERVCLICVPPNARVVGAPVSSPTAARPSGDGTEGDA